MPGPTIHVHPADETGCGSYRLIFPTNVLQQYGHDVVIGAKLDCLRERNELLGDFPVEVLVDADVVVFQRPLKRALVEIIPVLQRQGVAVVVEIDDDFHALPKGHPAISVFSPLRNPDRNWWWLRKAAELADLVTCTTTALAARYAPHGRFAVLPNCVPGWYLEVEGKPNDRPTIGWTGTTVTHVGDLDVCGRAIAEVQHDTGCHFRAIGSERTLQVLDVDGEVCSWCALDDRTAGGYPATVASLDIGLVPLADNRFNDAKSALKMCEYAALGVVPVVSPSADNQRMHHQGIGLVAESPVEWAVHVGRLVCDEPFRRDMAAAGREVMATWTYEYRAHLWMDAWEQAIANRRQGVAA